MSTNEKFLKEPINITTPNTGVIKLSNIQSVFNFIYNFKKNPSMKNIETDEFFIIGGGLIYNLFIPYIQKLYLTYVDVIIDGDIQLPNINKYKWNELESIDNKKDETHKYDYTFLTLKKTMNNE
jgi:dihydrofolate reductase